MNRKHLLFLSLLLSQTAPVWAMWNVDDERAMTAAGNGQPQLNAQFLDYVPALPPGVPALSPSDPLPQNLGTAKQRVRCTFANQATADVLLPTEYPLQGHWDFQEDRNNAQNIAILKLVTLLNQRQMEVYQRQVSLPHTLIDPGVETPEGYYFDGNTVYQARSKQQQWLNPRTQQHYIRTINIRDEEIPTHKDCQIIYVEPFAFANEPPRADKDAYRGEYRFIRDLNEQEGLPSKKLESLIYSDGNRIYLPHVTQELWRQGHSQVGFFVASYKQDRKLNFISQARIPNGQLAEGIYQIVSVEEQANRRIEKWKKLEVDPQTLTIIEIMTPTGIASIFGMGSFAPRLISTDQDVLQALALQENIQKIAQKTEDTAALHPNSAGSIIVLGPTGSGKTTFIHGLAGDLNAQEDQDGYLRLHANQPLSGFNIGHTAVVGTKIPNLWYDQVHNVLYWDCPGFGDPRGPKEDIVNAFAIDKLFQNSSVKVVLATSDFSLDIRNQRGRHFFDLLNEMTKLFTDEVQLQNALSLIVTQGGNPTPSGRLNALLREAQQGGANINLTPSASRLLSFLQSNSNRVSSMPQPQQEGPYPFNRQHILGCISRSQYVTNPTVDFKAGVSDAAKLLVVNLAQKLNQNLSHYMETEAAQRLINYCRHKIDIHSGPVATLRTEFKQLKRILKTLQNVLPDSPMNIVNILNPYIDIKEINDTINLLGFFKRIENNITYSVTEWATKLLDAVKVKIKNLAAAPQVEYINGALTLKGIFVGTSDINTALRIHQNPTQIHVYGLNTLFVDKNVTAQGVSVSLLAPYWKVIGARNINLSGKGGSHGAWGTHGSYNGASGGDGQPGKPGGNGGYFYGKGFFFNQLNQLTTNTNGGNGGSGGNGGYGANGTDGQDGGLGSDEIRNRTRIETSRTQNYVERGVNCDITFHDVSYTYPGSNGSAGGNGGRGGSGAMGGYHGISILEGHQWNSNPQNGNNGNDGNPGKPGRGGLHGEHCHAIVKRILNWQVVGNTADHCWKGYTNEGRGYASEGTQPLSSDLNASGQQQPAAQILFNAAPSAQTYKTYYNQQELDPNICSFMKGFPNL